MTDNCVQTEEITALSSQKPQTGRKAAKAQGGLFKKKKSSVESR